MKRVTIVNLAGRAWHVEADGADAIDAWLEQARTRLAADPDVDELLLDFERAIADRFATAAPGDRDVVTAEQARSVLDALGTVEPVDATGDDPASATTTAIPAATPEPAPPLRERRLYRLTAPEDAMLGGVCAGIAAYLRLDVTVVRVAFVVLALITSGAMLVVYVAMWLFVPEAVTAEQRAEARGEGRTAQEMISRARDSAGPALAKTGSLIGRIARALAQVLRAIVLVAIIAVLGTWAFAVGMLFIDGDVLLDLFDPGTSTWLVGLWVTCIAWAPVAVLLLIERALAWTLRSPEARAARPGSSATLVGGLAASLVAAILGIAAIPASSSEDLRSIADGRGTITVGDQLVCVDVVDDGNRNDPPVDCDDADIVVQDDPRYGRDDD